MTRKLPLTAIGCMSSRVGMNGIHYRPLSVFPYYNRAIPCPLSGDMLGSCVGLGKGTIISTQQCVR